MGVKGIIEWVATVLVLTALSGIVQLTTGLLATQAHVSSEAEETNAASGKSNCHHKEEPDPVPTGSAGHDLDGCAGEGCAACAVVCLCGPVFLKYVSIAGEVVPGQIPVQQEISLDLASLRKAKGFTHRLFKPPKAGVRQIAS